MRRRRIRSVPNLTAPVRTTAGWRPSLNGAANQIFGPQKNTAIEVGNKWELFDRHLLLSGRAVPDGKVTMRVSRRTSPLATATAACPYPANTIGSVACISAGAAYRIRGIDLEVAGKITDKWSVFGGLVLMKSEVTKSLIPPANTVLYSSQCRPAAGQHRESVFQPPEQISAQRRLGTWRAGGLPLEDLRRHLACREPGHVAAELLALRCIRGGEDQPELDR